MISIDELTDILAATEPINRIPFSVGQVTFTAITGQYHGMRARVADEPAGVFATLADETKVELTWRCFEEICSFVGLRPTSIADVPASLLVPVLNYWFDTGLTATRKPADYQFIVGNNLALAFTKQKIIPFSNLKLLDQARAAFTASHGDVEIVADAKVHHDLRRSVFRLVAPQITSQVAGERWSTGIQVRNSLTGRTQTTVDRYLLRWPNQSGQIDTACTIPPFTRRANATEDEAYAWARHAMDDALAAPEACLKAVEHLAQVPVPRNVTQLLRDVFEHHRIPLALRGPIIDNVVDHESDVSMYDVMTAISAVANRPDLDPVSIDLLMRTAGDLPYTGESRCHECDRLMHAH